MLSRELLVTLAHKGRVEIIRTLKSYPDRDFTINELSRASNVPVMTTWRAVKELKKAGLVKTRKVGNAVGVYITDDKDRLRALRLIPETDPQRTAAKRYASMLGEHAWLQQCRLFGSVGRGEHSPGEEVDVAVVFDDGSVSEDDAKATAKRLAEQIKLETNVTIVPLCIAQKEMSRKGGLAAELRDREIIWSR